MSFTNNYYQEISLNFKYYTVLVIIICKQSTKLVGKLSHYKAYMEHQGA